MLYNITQTFPINKIHRSLKRYSPFIIISLKSVKINFILSSLSTFLVFFIILNFAFLKEYYFFEILYSLDEKEKKYFHINI
jgi:hypothetical protein